jgi:hypothetical protein
MESKPNPSIPNDGSYKSLFSHPEMVKSLAQGFIKNEWVKQADFSTLERVNGSYVAGDFRQRHDDIVWRVRYKDTWLYFYLIVEFQSANDKMMALRMMVYEGLLYQDLEKSGQFDKAGLPPVFPIVLYNGAEAWTAPLNISDLIASSSLDDTPYSPKLARLSLG